MSLPPEVDYRRGYEPGFIGRIAQMHGEYYATLWTQGAKFEATVARDLADFCEAYVEGRDLLLTAHVAGQMAGSIAIDGSQSHRPGAHLRWFLVDPACRGLGIGRRLIEEGLAFARDTGHDRIFLWTVEGLPASRRLYDQAGFTVAEELRDDRYSAEQTVLRMELWFR